MHPLRFRVLSKAVLAARATDARCSARSTSRCGGRWRRPRSRRNPGPGEDDLRIYRKMVEKSLSFSEVLDIYGFRIVVNGARTAISRSARCTRCTSRCPASSRTTSPSQAQRLPVAAHDLLGRLARRSNSRSARRKCTASPRPGSPRTGCTRPTTPASPKCSRARTSGCSRCSRSSSRPAIRSK